MASRLGISLLMALQLIREGLCKLSVSTMDSQRFLAREGGVIFIQMGSMRINNIMHGVAIFKMKGVQCAIWMVYIFTSIVMASLSMRNAGVTLGIIMVILPQFKAMMGVQRI
ncbi:protein of unknown function [Maridesulfovibrio hydrothermalis AM13 = DSM 14728]|uniref:Uncharacterized protein n=1 Tax=Maridesulfovibrio hydrothermalis AM13 = DSM 14728 TaxID=1121451 RepID=L0R6C3_9BACT|nr:protein of unknown function [Maridesulfovibrio hydrothermalis AM13 = DSM 14728]